MLASIDNYSALNCISFLQPRLANVRYVTEIHRGVLTSTVVSYSSEKGINQRIIYLLNEYRNLTDNWDEDGAKAPSRNSLKSALYLTMLLEKHGQSIFHAAPGPNGEIMVDIRNKKNTKSLEIIFYENRFVSVLFSEDEKPNQRPFDVQHLPQLLQWLNQK